MARVTVTPTAFEYVDFENAEITAVAQDVCDRLGLPNDLDVNIDIDETEMVGRIVDVAAADGRIDVKVTGGAFESLHKARSFSPERSQSILGLVLLRATDRLTAGFADAPADSDLTIDQRSAWEAYSEGRFERAGFPVRKARRLYHFRLRHGFSDGIDAVFERLWSASNLTWADIDAACAETKTLDPGPLTPTP